MKGFVYISIFVLLIVGFFSNSVNACTVTYAPLRKQFRWADSVFIGKVVKVVEYAPTDKEINSIPENWRDWKVWSKVTFEVEKKWKGNISKTQEFISIAYYICACSTTVTEFKENKEYLVFSQKQSFVFVCDSDENESEYAEKKIKHIDNFGFRLWSKIYPF
jgi:hypothetical protein